MTQRNASSAEELSSTAEEMASQADAMRRQAEAVLQQAESLHRLMAFFRIGASHVAPASPSVPASAGTAEPPDAWDAVAGASEAAAFAPFLAARGNGGGHGTTDADFRRTWES